MEGGVEKIEVDLLVFVLVVVVVIVIALVSRVESFLRVVVGDVAVVVVVVADEKSKHIHHS